MRAHRAPQLYQRVSGGAWWCYWQGDRWSTKTPDRREAERIVREHYDPHRLPASSRTIEDAIELLYAALDRRGRSQSTKDQAREKLGHFARLWHGKSLAGIDYATLAEYDRVRLEDDGVKRITVSHERGYLRQAWKLARANGWTTRAWDELAPERFDRGYRPRTRWLTPAEVEAVLAELEPVQAAWVAWLVATGSDVGDVPRARPEDVDWKRGVVRVRGSKNVFRDRLVPITPLTRKLLQRAVKHGPPFVGAWVTATSPNAILRRLAARLGMPHFTPKDLRRTHGTWLRHGGVDLDYIGRVLGHADGSPLAATTYASGEDSEIASLVQAQLRAKGVRMRRTNEHQRAPTAHRTGKK